MSQSEPPKPSFCPTCGAQNPVGTTRCGVCGQPLAKRDDLDRLWGHDPNISKQPDEVIDLYPVPDVSLQTTIPFTQTRPFDPSEYRTAPPASAARTISTTPVAPSQSTPPPAGPPTVSYGTTRKGPHGCVLGCFALILILAVAALVVWGAVRPTVSNHVEDEISTGIANELRTIDTVAAPPSGQIVLTEDQINADLKQQAARYDPINDVTVRIRPDGIEAKFKLYGLAATFHGNLVVENGRILVLDPKLDGLPSRAIDVNDVTKVFEQEVNEFFARSGLTPAAIRLRDGSLVIETGGGKATPTARPRPATPQAGFGRQTIGASAGTPTVKAENGQ